MCEEVKKFLTNEFCVNLITKKLKTNEFKIIDTTIKPLSDTPQGYSGTHYFIHFKIQTNGELNSSSIVKFFLKLKLDPKESDLGSTKFNTPDNDIYLRETQFLKLVTKYKVEWAPKFYDCFENRLLILEDLSERGFKVPEKSFDLNHCYVGLQALANLHAFYFKYVDDKKKSNSNFSILEEYPFFFKEVLMQLDTESGKNWYEASKNCMNFVLDEMSTCNLNIKSKANEEFKNLYEYLKPRENSYNVLSHGDLHLNNIMFSYENDFPKQCCFIDFQVLRFLPLPTDVLMLLHLNAPTELRKDSLSELLEYYYKQLTVELTKVGLDTSVIYPKNVFKTAINDSTVPVLLFNCMYKPFMVMDKKRLAECIKENSEDLMFGDRAKYIKREFDIDENYKKELFKEFQLLIDEIVKIV